MKQLICMGTVSAAVLLLLSGGAKPAQAGDFYSSGLYGGGPYAYGSYRYDYVPSWYRSGFRGGYSAPFNGYSRYYGRATGLPYWYETSGFGPYADGYVGMRSAAERVPENIVVDVFPPDASVYVNGERYSSSGKTQFKLPTGTWKLELRAPDYDPQTVELKVEPGIGYTIRRNLQRAEQRPSRGTPGRNSRPL